mgnify:CR=1 FL=1
MFIDEVSSAPGSVSQVREATSRLMHLERVKIFLLLLSDMLQKTVLLPDLKYWNIWWILFSTLREINKHLTEY